MRSRLVDPQKLHKDLGNYYLSNYLINELREFYTIKERESYYQSRPSDLKPRMECKKQWPICYLALEASKNQSDHQILRLTSNFILSNFKANHFAKEVNPQGPKIESFEAFSEKLNNQKLLDEDLLMERQAHICPCIDKEFAKMKSEVKTRISKQVANLEAQKKSMNVDKNDLQETNQVYETFIKKRRGTLLSSHDDMSGYSQSIGSKPSHDISHYNNTCKLR